MMKKSSAKESKLRNLIRQMVKEELAKMGSHPEGGWMPGPFDFSPQRHGGNKKDTASPHPELAEWEDGPWAVFGPPEPDPDNLSRFKQQKPRVLPDWSEPFEPDFGHFETPPFIPKRNKKR